MRAKMPEPARTRTRPRTARLEAVVVLALAPLVWGGEPESNSRLPNKVIPLQADNVPERPFTFDLGTRFLKPGRTGPEIELSTGAVWQPSFFVFGTLRTAVQSFNDGETNFAEWANRLDLFGELRLSGTERLLVGIRPLDEDGQFTSFNFEPQEDNDWQTAFNGELTTLFFEGDFGELFPLLDPKDSKRLDFGFAIGRQPIIIQEGLLINDTIDAVGLVRNTLLPRGTSNLRLTLLYAWHELDRGNNFRGNNIDDDAAQLWGLFTEFDTRFSTINLDAAYVHSSVTGDSFFTGVSAVQRIGHLNTSLRAVASFPTTGATMRALPTEDERRPTVAVGAPMRATSPAAMMPMADEGDPREVAQNTRGYLYLGELSWTPPKTHDLLYLNCFYADDRFSSAARDPTSGGPLGRTGILFAAVGLGRYGSPLSNQAEDAYGFALGYQRFLDHDHRKQLIVEAGGRKDTNGTNDGSGAVGMRYQQAFGQRTIMQIDAFVGGQEQGDAFYGSRIEFRFQF